MLCANDAELAELRSGVRAFLAADRDSFGWTPAVDSWLSSWDTEFSVRLADAGFIGLTIPVEYGGRAPADGTGYLHRYVVTEELLAHGAPVGAHWIADRQVAPGLLAYGTEEQRQRLLPRIAAGRLYSSIGMSEHGAGSDLAAVQSRATRSDDGWRLNGTKVWTSGAHLAHQIVVLARTSPLDPNHRHAGFSQFIVPTDLPGITISPIVLMNGEHHFNEVLFDDVRLTDADVLGEIGAGWHQVTSELGFERSGPERFLSTALLLFEIITALRRGTRGRPNRRGRRRPGGADDLAAPAVGVGGAGVDRGSGRQHPGGSGQGSRDPVRAGLRRAGRRPDRRRARAGAGASAGVAGDRAGPLTDVHAARRYQRSSSRRHRQGSEGGDVNDELKHLVDEIGERSASARVGHHELPEAFDEDLWRVLETSGLTRLTSEQGADPADAAVVLGGLARHAAAVPIAETDLLAAWLAGKAELEVPADGPLTVAVADVEARDGRIVGTAADVPWPAAGPVVLAAMSADATFVAVLDPGPATGAYNLAGEPRADLPFDLPLDGVARLPRGVGEELLRRGAWARCVQIVGAFDAAVDLTTAHIRDRVQFGRPLSAFQAVQHSLAAMIGEVERSRATTALAIAAANDHGFDSPRAEFAVTVAKVAVGRAVAPVTTIAHQLHGAIGVTAEHQLWLATMRARSWADEFGTTGQHATRLGRMALADDDAWKLVVGS